MSICNRNSYISLINEVQFVHRYPLAKYGHIFTVTNILIVNESLHSAVKIWENFSDKHRVSFHFQFNIVEEKEETFVVVIQESKDGLILKTRWHVLVVRYYIQLI